MEELKEYWYKVEYIHNGRTSKQTGTFVCPTGVIPFSMLRREIPDGAKIGTHSMHRINQRGSGAVTRVTEPVQSKLPSPSPTKAADEWWSSFVSVAIEPPKIKALEVPEKEKANG